MLTKRSVMILIIIAIILVGVAIAIQLSDTEEISTKKPITGNLINGGNIGIDIIPSPVEDKLADKGQT
jgi:hypothetical protein